MIDRIDIKNFKCFSDAKIELNAINIFTGVNAAGKSTAIQALLLAFASLKEKENSVDVNNALGIQIGNPSVLRAQNPSDNCEGDFSFIIYNENNKIDFIYSIDRLSPLSLPFNIKNSNGLDSQIFYLNAERCGPRISYPAGGESIIEDGSNAVYIVERADMQNVVVPESVRAIDSIKFSDQVEAWMDAVLGDVQVSLKTDLNKASTDILYKNSLVDYAVFPTMTGFGISYVFSVIAMGLWCSAKKNVIFIIENPEAHLHPAAQSRIGKFLQIISLSGVQIIVETHSEHVIDGIRLQAAYMEQTDHVTVDFFNRRDKDIDIKKIWLDKNGELSDWPKDFFDQKSIDLRELLKIRRGNASKQ